MAIWDVWLGSIGPTLVDDTRVYRDGLAKGGIRFTNRDTGDTVIFDGNSLKILVADPDLAPFTIDWADVSDPSTILGNIFFRAQTDGGLILQANIDDAVTPDRGVVIGPFLDLLQTGTDPPPAATGTGAGRIYKYSGISEHKIGVVFSDGTQRDLVLSPVSGSAVAYAKQHLASFLDGVVSDNQDILKFNLPFDFKVTELHTSVGVNPSATVALALTGGHSVSINTSGVGTPTIINNTQSAGVLMIANVNGSAFGMEDLTIRITGDWL